MKTFIKQVLFLVSIIFCNNRSKYSLPGMYDDDNQDKRPEDEKSRNDQESDNQNERAEQERKAKTQDIYEAFGLDKDDYKEKPEDLEQDNLLKKEQETETDKSNSTYRINKQELSESEIIGKIKEDYGFEFPNDITSEAKQKFIQDYVNSKNLTEGKKAINEKHQENAESKKENERFRLELEDKERELAIIETRIKKAQEIVSEDLSDIYDEDEKTDKRVDQRLAQKEIEQLELQKKQVETEADRIKSDAVYNYHVALINELQTKIPGLKTEKAVEDILYNFDNGKTITTLDEVAKAEMVIEIINDYATTYQNSKSRPTILEYFEVKKHKYNIPTPLGQEVKEKYKSKTFAEVLAEKQKNYKQEPEVRNSSFTAKGTQDGNRILSNLGY